MFTHLHLHTEFSPARRPEPHPRRDGSRRARSARQSVAMTDHGALYGAIDFYKEARARGIKPIIGIEAYIAPDSRHKKSGLALEQLLPPDAAGEGRAGLPQPDAASARSRTSRASTTSRAWTRSCSPSTARASSPSAAAPPARCTGCSPRAATTRRAKLAGFFKDVFDDFYLEVMRHDEPEINAECDTRAQGPRAALEEDEDPARRDERLALHGARGPRRSTTCCSASARTRTVDDPKRAAEDERPRLLREVRGRDARRSSRSCRRPSPTRSSSPSSATSSWSSAGCTCPSRRSRRAYTPHELPDAPRARRPEPHAIRSPTTT